MAQKNPRTFFLSKSKVQKNFQFGYNFLRKNCYSMVLKVSTEQRIFNTLEYTKKGTREFK